MSSHGWNRSRSQPRNYSTPEEWGSNNHCVVSWMTFSLMHVEWVGRCTRSSALWENVRGSLALCSSLQALILRSASANHRSVTAWPISVQTECTRIGHLLQTVQPVSIGSLYQESPPIHVCMHVKQPWVEQNELSLKPRLLVRFWVLSI